MKKLIKKKQLENSLEVALVDRIYNKIAELKSIIDTGENSSAYYNRQTYITTSIWLTGNQVLFDLTPEDLRRDIRSAVYEAMHIAKKRIRGY